MPYFRRAVPDANFGVLRKLEPELTQHSARVDHGAGTVGCGLVPDRWQTQNRVRIAGAEGAHDEVMHRWSVLHRDHVLALPAADSKFRYRGGRIGQQARLV